jgi:hypothetical protein
MAAPTQSTTGTTQAVVHGARAQLLVNGVIQGVFTNVSWGVNYDAVPNFILGRFSPAEITYVGQDAISVNATGFRVFSNGAYVSAGLPLLQNLMTYQDISLAIFDRQNQANIVTVVGVKPVSYSSSVAARSVSEFSVSFLGLRAEDENFVDGEAAGASYLLSGT